ncbi:hypothetical protein K440DRAFT_625193 [Wilcoxina mikolae CBS 423.85]|nr:hypothetical protein K440DRAFT_625193 [Wilcoxina mikolae CBS 423.85]
MESTLTCTDSSLPYCRRWTHTSGYSRYECATFPTVLSLETPIFTASVGTPSSASASASATPCPKQVSTGGIVGGVIGGMAVLVAGVIGGMALLRRGRGGGDTHSVGSQGQLLAQQAQMQSPAKVGEYSGPQGGPSAPPYGVYPQGQQPAIELS